MKRILALILFLSGVAWGQNTSVTGQVTDSNSIPWKNGTFKFTFVGPPGAQWTGGALPSTVTGSLTSSGSIPATSVPSNSQINPPGTSWIAQACSATLPQVCYSTPVTITGASQTVNLTPNAISIQAPSSPQLVIPVTLYDDSEVSGGWVGFSYYNTTAAQSHICSAVTGQNCSAWVAGSSGVSSVGLALPASLFTISGSPVSSTGTLTGAFITNFAANSVFGNCTAAPATPGACSLTAAMIPTAIPIGNVGSAGLSGTAPVTISAAGAMGCATCVTASAPGAGIAHFAGATQAVTSSAIVQGDVTNGYVDLSSTQSSIAGAKTFTTSVTVSGLFPTSAGAVDIGSTALPFGNLWIGTAATNNFKLQPAATAAARVISILDPGVATTLNLASSTSTTANQPMLSTTTAGVEAPSGIAYPTSLVSGGILYGSSTTQISSSALIAANKLIKSGGSGTQPVASSITSSQTANLTSDTNVFQGSNTIRLTANSSAITALTPGTAVLTFGTLPVSTNLSFHCHIMYNQQTAAVAGTGFAIQGATNAPTRLDAWGNMFTSQAGAAVEGVAQNITTTTATPVVSGTPSAITTVFNADIFGTLQNGASTSTLTLLAFTGNAADSITVQAGSFCSIAP